MKKWPVEGLGDILSISRERIEPLAYPKKIFNYIGLESIVSHTGTLHEYQPSFGASIKSTKNVFHKNEILYGKLRPYLNKVHLANMDGICSTDIYVLQVDQQKILPSFAANYLRSPSVLSILSSAMAGANLPRINHDALLNIQIPVPALPEQERIVNLLDEADQLRKLRGQADKRSAELIPALFEEMFGDPDKNPKGWQVKRLQELCQQISDIDHNMPKAIDDGVPFISAKDLTDNHKILFDNVKKISRADFVRLSRKIKPQRGDIIYSRIGAKLGKARLVEVDFDFLASYSCCTIRPNQKAANSVFLCVFLNMPSVLSKALQGVRAIGVPDLGMGEINDFKVILPPLSLQNEFASHISAIYDIEEDQSSSRKNLDALFQSMLHRAFQGEL